MNTKLQDNQADINVLQKAGLNLPVQNYINNNFCVHELFEQQVSRTPGNIALVFGDKIYTYSELNSLSNKLAFFLRQQYKITPGKIIGILLERSEKTVVAMLAVLKAGGAYLPLDPDLHPERISFICEDAGVDVMLFDGSNSHPPDLAGVNFVDFNNPKVFSDHVENLAGISRLADPAYVIFTSGSTGNPKGAVITNRSVVNFLKDSTRRFNMNQHQVVLNLNSFFFDASVWELLTPLLSGARLSVLAPGAHKYPEKILQACADNAVTTFFITPGLLQSFLSYLEANPSETVNLISLQRIIAGGETLTPKLANLFNKLLYAPLGVLLTNIYGPTETTVWVTVFDCESDKELNVVPIGKPIDNTQIYILNIEGNLTAEGEKGELVVGGTPVGYGYLNRPELDREKFIRNPYKEGEKMYRTGDMARYLPDGNIEFLGRIDNQVKLNGFRIELSEIENVVLKNTHVKECIVMMRNISGNNELVLYYTLTASGIEQGGTKEDRITTLLQTLPGYMIPSFFVELTAFPLTANGKIDRKILPLPLHRYHQRISNYIAPSSTTEKKISAILSRNLKVKDIGVEDNIFDMGVKSLIVTKVIIEIEAALQTKLTLPVFFQLPTIKQLGAYIDFNHGEVENPVILLRNGTKRPLFMLPGAYANALTFVNFLNRYKISQSIYSISYPDDKGFAAFESISAYAGYLVKYIRKIQPHGPYNLLGFSLGGTLAFEVAKKLQDVGEEIDLLAIISADAPTKKSLISNQIFAREFKFLMRPNAYLLKKYFKYRVPFLFKRFVNKFVSKKIGIHIPFEKTNTIKLVEKHTSTTKFKGDILLFTEDVKNTDFFDFSSDDPYTLYVMEKLWRSQVIGKVDCIKMTCAHGDIFSEAMVHNITAVIEKYFEKSLV